MALNHYQSAYGAQPIGEEGTIANNDRDQRVISLKNGEASAAIRFGRFVTRDASNPATECELPDAASDSVIGLSIAPCDGRVLSDSSSDRDYDAGVDVDVLQTGTAWVVATETVTAGGQAFALITPSADEGKAAASVGGTKAQTSLTVSGELDGGIRRIQTLTFDADFVGSNTIDLDIDGSAMAQVTFSSNHNTTMDLLLTAIKQRLADNGSHADAELSDIDGNNRIITILSDDATPSATSDAVTNITVAGGVSQPNGAMADQQAGAAPHALSVAVDGTTVGPVVWAGSHDDTMELFAEQLAGLASVETAEVTVVPAGDDVTIVLTAAAYGADTIDLSSPTVSNGATSRTMSVNNEVTAGTTQDAIAVAGAVYLDSGSASDLVRVRLDING